LSHAASSTAQASSSVSSRKRLPTFAAPYPSAGIRSSVCDMRALPLVLGDTLGLHLHADTGSGGRHVRTALNVGRHHKVVVQMIDELDQAPFARARDSDEVEHRQVLHCFAQA